MNTTIRIRLMFLIECSADSAWQAVHTPSVASALYRPLLTMNGRNGQLPDHFEPGDSVDVTIRALGVIPMGAQRIAIDDIEKPAFPPGSRTMRDAGRPLSGPLALLSRWNHEITVLPIGAGTDTGTAAWHDELTIGGLMAPLFALVLAPMWHWRKWKIRRLSRRWHHNFKNAHHEASVTHTLLTPTKGESRP